MHLDPVLAYDRIAPEFAAVSDRRRDYLAAIDQLVLSGIPTGSRSLLDVGAGNGSRAVRIAAAAGIRELVLLDPSAEMRRKWPERVQKWAIRAEDLVEKAGSFDVILCLWNVPGHIFPAARRVEVLRQCARLLSGGGRLFIDVNHRYNAAEYGVLPTALRMIRDLVSPGERNGDVVVRWKVGDTEYATDGHVFTEPEFRHMAEQAGLAIDKQYSVSYATGQIRRSKFAGNPLFILRRA